MTTDAKTKNPFESFDPMAMWTRSQEMMRDAFADAVTRSQAFTDHISTMEQDAVTRANAAVTAWAQLAHDTITYSAQLSAEARKLAADAMRSATGFATGA
jgi:hypothetical protein